MKEIIKSQLYETVKSKSVWIAALVIAYFAGLECCARLEFEGGENVCTGTMAMGLTMDLYAVAFFTFIIAAFMCRDYKNRTINHDILWGYSRKQVFFGRMIPAYVIGSVASFIYIYPAVIYQTIKYGWGSDVTALSMVLRNITFLLLLFRLTGEIALLSVVIKRTWIVYGILLLFGSAQQRAVFSIVINGYYEKYKYLWLLSGSAGSQLILTPGYEEVFNDAGEIVKQFEQILPMQAILVSVLSSILIGTLCLYAAFSLFSKRDMD